MLFYQEIKENNLRFLLISKKNSLLQVKYSLKM